MSSMQGEVDACSRGAATKMLAELGLVFTLDDNVRTVAGRSMAYYLDRISGLLGKAPPGDFLRSYRARTKAVLETQLTAVPGIEQALDEITLPYCIASSGDHEKMRMTLGITGLWPRFEGKIVSVTEVKAPKAAPDIFCMPPSVVGARPIGASWSRIHLQESGPRSRRG